MDWYCNSCEEFAEEGIDTGDSEETGEWECPNCGDLGRVHPIT